MWQKTTLPEIVEVAILHMVNHKYGPQVSLDYNTWEKDHDYDTTHFQVENKSATFNAQTPLSVSNTS